MTEDPVRPAGHGLWRAYVAALVVGVAVAAVRLLPELALIKGVADGQGGISVAWALVVASVAFMLAAALTLLAMQTKGKWRVVCGTLLVLLAGYALWQTVFFLRVGNALDDAADPATSPERLRALNGYDTFYFGYEIDNRLASNPSSPEDLLRALAHKDQMGTLMSLRRNPNTPADVLESLPADDE